MLRPVYLCLHAVTPTPAVTDGICPLVLSHRYQPSPSVGRVGSCIGCFGACSVFTAHTACRLAKSPKATLYIRGFSGFVTSTTAPIATGRSEPVSRAGLSTRGGPAPFHGAPTPFS